MSEYSTYAIFAISYIYDLIYTKKPSVEQMSTDLYKHYQYTANLLKTYKTDLIISIEKTITYIEKTSKYDSEKKELLSLLKILKDMDVTDNKNNEKFLDLNLNIHKILNKINDNTTTKYFNIANLFTIFIIFYFGLIYFYQGAIIFKFALYDNFGNINGYYNLTYYDILYYSLSFLGLLIYALKNLKYIILASIVEFLLNGIGSYYNLFGSFEQPNFNYNSNSDFFKQGTEYYDKYYDFFRLNKDATIKDLKAAYREYSLKYHPDKGGLTDEFINLQNNFDVLNNYIKRKKNDGNNLELSLYREKYLNTKNYFKSLIKDIEHSMNISILRKIKRSRKRSKRSRKIKLNRKSKRSKK